MKEYIDLTKIYTTRLKFGNYVVDQRSSKVIIDPNILKLYNYTFDLESEHTVFLSTKIQGKEQCVMASHLFERLTNQNFIDNAKGDIIIFGLGLGLVIFPLLNDSEITSITVVDNSIDIIDNIGPIIKSYDINNKLTLINGDAFTYYQQLNEAKFDVMYFDYWNYVDETIQNDMYTLKELYKNNIKEAGQIMYWCEDLFTNGIINI
jgi:spermidine synthase